MSDTQKSYPAWINQIDKEQVKIARKLTEKIRKDYNQALVRARFGNKLVQRFQTKNIEKTQTRTEKVHQYWTYQKANYVKIPQSKRYKRFDLEAFVELTDQERINLTLLKLFKSIQWFKDTKTARIGHGIGHESLDWTGEAASDHCHLNPYKSQAICQNTVCLAAMNRHCF